ncbi:MAG: aspartate/glutamate racemase family protein [Candidatus Paceibacterota bacterium]|jgi:aspartate racemase
MKTNIGTLKTIGIIGGMSWESTNEYTRIMNELVKQKLGGLSSAKIIVEYVNFAEIAALQQQNRWEDLASIMTRIAQKLEMAGAECIVIATNTMHKVADEVQSSISIPLIHIADALAEEIKKKKMKKVALLGTRVTMEEYFYKGRLAKNHGIEVMIPSVFERAFIDRVIFKELCQGKFDRNYRITINNLIGRLGNEGAEGIILGCTELPLLITQKELDEQLGWAIPLFDTTTIHATAAIDFALRNTLRSASQ